MAVAAQQSQSTPPLHIPNLFPPWTSDGPWWEQVALPFRLLFETAVTFPTLEWASLIVRYGSVKKKTVVFFSTHSIVDSY